MITTNDMFIICLLSFYSKWSDFPYQSVYPSVKKWNLKWNFKILLDVSYFISLSHKLSLLFV